MTDTAALFARLIARAAAIAATHAEARRTAPARRWRDARWLWPAFTKD